MSDYSELTEEEILMPYEDIEKDEKDETPDENNFKLSSYGIDFDVSGLVRRLNNESIYLPDFQRNYVWTIKKASKFIESLLLGLPIPGIFLYKEDEAQKMLIIDGFQRLETIKLFYQGLFGKRKFMLSDVVEEFEGKSYFDLSDEYKRKIDDTLLHATIIKADDPKEKNFNAIYMIFERLNTGGVNLSPQEIRNCVSHGKLQKALVEISKNEDVRAVLKLDPKRKKDQEIILRLISLSAGYADYKGNMKQYLNNFMYDNKDLKDDKISAVLNKTLSIFKIFTELGSDLILRPNGSLNLAILDSLWVGLYHRLCVKEQIDMKELRLKIAELLESNEYKEAISTGRTHHKESVNKRINIAIKELREVK